MAEFSKLVITNKGQALIAKMMAEEGNIKFTKVVASSTEYTESQLEGLSELSNVKQTSLISKVTRTNEVAVKVKVAFTNTDLTEGYYMRALGLYAVDPDVGEILYAVTAEISGNCYMPPYNGITVSGAYVQLVTTVGNADSITLEVDQAAIATIGDIQDLQEQISELEAFIGYISDDEEVDFINKKFTSLIKAVSSSIAHLDNSNNPHGVTKAHVELGNCDDTSDVNKPVSTAQRAAIDEAYKQSTEYTKQKIANLVNGAPSTMDTLKEIADAMEENQDVVEALEAAIGSKANENEFESHRTNNNIHVTTTEKQQIQAHGNFIQDFINLFPAVADHKKATYQLGGGLDAKQIAPIYTAEEKCLVILNGFIQFLAPPDGATMIGNLLINDTIITATTLCAKETGSNIPLAANLRLNEGECINVLTLCSGLSPERGVMVNIHYFLKTLPLQEKQELS